MKLQEDPFERIKNGTKTVEFRLYDEKRQTIQIGDEIEFSKLPELQEKLLVKVIDLYKEESFEKLFKKVFVGEDKEKIIEKEISETDLDHIKSGPNELVIGNFWIFKGKITILKSSVFPIDPFIIMYTAILMEIIFWIKAKISRFRENKSSKIVVITGGDEIGS